VLKACVHNCNIDSKKMAERFLWDSRRLRSRGSFLTILEFIPKGEIQMRAIGALLHMLKKNGGLFFDKYVRTAP
jgi:hypothetical protein